MSEPSRPAPSRWAPAPSRFVAVTTRLAEREWTAALQADAANSGWLLGARSRTIAAWGTAALLPLPRGLEDAESVVAVTTWLAAVPHLPGVTGSRPLDAGSTGEGLAHHWLPWPCALGALPFDRGAPSALVVPATVIGRTVDGRVWRTDVTLRERLRRAAPGPSIQAGAPTSPSDAVPRAPRGTVPRPRGRGETAGRTAHVTEVPAGGAYAAMVARALQDIGAGAISKVVLSRSVDVQLPRRVLASAVLDALWDGDDALSPYSAPTPAGRLVGASPELIVGRLGRSVTSHAFAGTAALPSDGVHGSRAEIASRLVTSVKDRVEHALVVEEIARALAARCESVSVPDEPSVVDLRSDARLGTLIRATLPEAPPGATSGAGSALELLTLLHPTPAVGGVPRDAALERIAELEARPRGYWAGVVGWADGQGDGEWVLAIRNVLLDGGTASVRAGAGVVAGSEPLAELRETTVKLTAALEAVWPGASSRL